MKNLKFYITIGLLVTLVGCSDFLNINTNPNAPSASVPDPVLAGALVESARIYSVDVPQFAAYWAGYWAASGTYSNAGNVTQNFKLLTTSFGQVPWGSVYLNISNYTLVANSGKGYEYYNAISRIMMAWGYHTIVDTYGNAPYSKAEVGFKDLNPTYDVDQTIYEKLVGQLDTAVVIIKAAQAAGTSKAVPATTDVMFGGNMSSWIALANTMNLRLLLRMSNVSSEQAFITAAIAKIVANGGGFLGAGQDAQINPGYQNAAGLQNPFWATNGLGVGGDVGGRDFNRTSAYSLAFFQNNHDPRVDYYFRTPGDLPGVNSKSKPYFSIPWGIPPTTIYVSAATSGFGVGVMGSASQPVTFLSAAESLFLQAEAAQRGWLNAGQEQAFYESGITESFRLLGVPGYQATASTYYTQASPNVSWAASTDKLQAIIVQKWAANCSIDVMESWCDVRRTGYPSDLPASQDPNQVSSITPVRLLYPQSEYNTNSVNVPPSITPYAPKVFWNQ